MLAVVVSNQNPATAPPDLFLCNHDDLEILDGIKLFTYAKYLNVDRLTFDCNNATMALRFLKLCSCGLALHNQQIKQ
jgi:hypothetical protein